MRNRIQYCQEYPADLEKYVVINLSQKIAEIYNGRIGSLMKDPFTQIGTTIHASILDGTKRVLLTNLGILTEPGLSLNPAKILLDLALDYDVVVLWNGIIKDKRIFRWEGKNEVQEIEFPANTLYRLETAP